MVTKDGAARRGAAASFACCECMRCLRVGRPRHHETEEASVGSRKLPLPAAGALPPVRRGDWKRDERKEEEQLLRLRQLFHSNRLLLTLNERARNNVIGDSSVVVVVVV